MLDLLNGFVGQLREAGLPVSLTESLDAMEAVRHIPLEDREAFKYALGATLVKSNAHWKAFETIFEVYFSLRGPQFEIDGDEGDDALAQMLQELMGQHQEGGSLDGLTPEELAEMLYQALMDGDEATMKALA